MTLKTSYIFKKIIFIIAVACAANLFCVSAARAQEIEAKIKIASVSSSRVSVEGRLLNPKGINTGRAWSFLQNYADLTELGTRIENFSLFDENGGKIEVKKLIAGEFQADKPAISFAYDVRLEVPSRLASAAHVSWLSNDSGLLMLNDLLPQLEGNQPMPAKITFELPDGWETSSSEIAIGKNTFNVKSVEKAIFLVGRNWREKTAKIDKTDLNLAISGEWQFSDEEALQMASSILEEYRKLFGDTPVRKTQILLLPFPQKTNQTERWQAETRGATVTLLSGAIPLKSQALQRLHEQLRHEIFHLWVPNALALSGNYDWFYEGFTVYQALRAGVQLNQIRFEDFLSTLARAYDLSQNQNASLIEISKKRWSNSNNSVYAKGMIAAFLSDAVLLRESKGKHSIQDIFQQVYQKHRLPNAVQDSNTSILNILKSYPELRPIVQNHIEGTAKFEWRDDLNALGIESVSNNSVTQLKVMSKLSGRQKDLLDKLGYNQWRKLLQKTK